MTDAVEMGPVRAFCLPGRHASEAIIGNTMDGSILPEGWVLVPARFSVTGERWIADDASPASIVCCPNHIPSPDDRDLIQFVDLDAETQEAFMRMRDRSRDREDLIAKVERARRVHRARSMRGWSIPYPRKSGD